MKPIDFTLRQLEYFVAAVETGSLSAAAERCHVSQGAVSQAIAELESTLGHQLLTRHKARGVGLTGPGQSLLQRARRVTEDARELREHSIDLQQELVGRVAIGCYTTISPFIMPFVAKSFALPFPGLEVTFEEGSSDQLQRRMLDGELDCVFMLERQTIPGVVTERLKEGKPYVLLSADHRFAAQPVVSLRELLPEPMVLLDLPAVRQNLLPMLERVGIVPRIAWRTSVIETVRSLVARDLGWSVLVQRITTDVSYEGLPVVRREIAEPIESSNWCIALPAAGTPSYRLRVLAERAREQARFWR